MRNATFSFRAALSSAALDAVNGGNDDDYGGGDDWIGNVDTSATSQPSAAVDASPIPPMSEPLPPPTVNDFAPLPTPTPEEARATAESNFRTQVDIAQNYRDLASPTELFQAGRDDCGVVTSINALNARDPETIASLVQNTRRPEVLQATTVGRDGQIDSTYVNPFQLQPVGAARRAAFDTTASGFDVRGGAYTDDPGLQSLYNAATQRYFPSRGGVYPQDAMERLGADAYTSTPSSVAESYRNGEGAGVLWTGRAASLPADYASKGLIDTHAYQLTSIIRNEADGRDYAVLNNPHGPSNYALPGTSRHPAAIPVDDLDKYFGAGTLGAFSRAR